jgi:2-oxoglutarate/2-oxoacid ferredoxin oxidoreductase subunit beta
MAQMARLKPCPFKEAEIYGAAHATPSRSRDTARFFRLATSTVTNTPAPKPKVNRLGLQVLDYRGGKTTLCAGCGHNAISERIIDAMYDMGVQPERLLKLSGIGCSSKSPAYFMGRAHSFNSVHGRMPSVATGALLGNHTMKALGVSGDGDTASIGVGQFIHLMRRNLPLIYIIEDNGVYGLTKGQFSATADLGSKLKTGVVNDLPAIDTCTLAIQLGATFVGRSFSGDKKQLLAMLKAAIAHKGTVMLDVISPCVTFNDHEGSTKSYKYMQEHEEAITEVGFVPHFEDIAVDYDPGTTYDVEMHDGSHLRLRKLHEDYDPSNRVSAVKALMESHERGEVLTGVFYVDTGKPSFIDLLNVVDEPLGQLAQDRVRPGKPVLDEIMGRLK